MFFAAHCEQCLSEGAICSDSASHAQPRVIQLSEGQAAFFDHDFDRGGLESCGQIGDQFGRSAGELIGAGDPASGVEYGGFESGETEVKFARVQQRSWHAKAAGVTGCGGLLN